MTIVDTGPLVAMLSSHDIHHGWALAQSKVLAAPFITCPPVLTEAFHLLARSPRAKSSLFELLESNALLADFEVQHHYPALRALMEKYQSVPMSLADACLVRMAELQDSAPVFTIDSDFQIYRKNRNKPIPLVVPV
jgi:predicted nucleic acid-binding protein